MVELGNEGFNEDSILEEEKMNSCFPKLGHFSKVASQSNAKFALFVTHNLDLKKDTFEEHESNLDVDDDVDDIKKDLSFMVTRP